MQNETKNLKSILKNKSKSSTVIKFLDHAILNACLKTTDLSIQTIQIKANSLRLYLNSLNWRISRVMSKLKIMKNVYSLYENKNDSVFPQGQLVDTSCKFHNSEESDEEYQQLLKELELENKILQQEVEKGKEILTETNMVNKYKKHINSEISSIADKMTNYSCKSSEKKRKYRVKRRTTENLNNKTLLGKIKESADKRSQFKRISYVIRAQSHDSGFE